eukprot:gene17348-12083_t
MLWRPRCAFAVLMLFASMYSAGCASGWHGWGGAAGGGSGPRPRATNAAADGTPCQLVSPRCFAHGALRRPG